MPSVYWPAGNQPNHYIPVDSLLYDLVMAKEWACPPWEVSGNSPEIWRPIYRLLASFQNEVENDLAWEKRLTEGGGKRAGNNPMFKPRQKTR